MRPVQLLFIGSLASTCVTGCVPALYNTQEVRDYLEQEAEPLPESFDLYQSYAALSWRYCDAAVDGDPVFTVVFNKVEGKKIKGTCFTSKTGWGSGGEPSTWDCDWWVKGRKMYTPVKASEGVIGGGPPINLTGPREAIWEVEHDLQSRTLHLVRLFVIVKQTGEREVVDLRDYAYFARAENDELLRANLKRQSQPDIREPTPAHEATPSLEQRSIETRLQELEALREKGIINEEEYAEKKKAILKDL